MEHNTSAMVENIWGDLREKLAFVLCQEHCARAGMMKTSDGRGTKPRFLKNLSVVWQKFETRFDETNTLLIDDDSYKVVKNPPNTAIHPSPFTVADRESDDGLGPNGALRLYLEKLHECDSVPAFVKTNPFVDAAPRAVADDIEAVGARLEALSVRDGAKKKPKPKMRGGAGAGYNKKPPPKQPSKPPPPLTTPKSLLLAPKQSSKPLPKSVDTDSSLTKSASRASKR
tara:strand:- start:7147 stop:7830 length:684 start_codon:yes stop_codon:yes gene_type:complete